MTPEELLTKINQTEKQIADLEAVAVGHEQSAREARTQRNELKTQLVEMRRDAHALSMQLQSQKALSEAEEARKAAAGAAAEAEALRAEARNEREALKAERAELQQLKEQLSNAKG